MKSFLMLALTVAGMVVAEAQTNAPPTITPAPVKVPSASSSSSSTNSEVRPLSGLFKTEPRAASTTLSTTKPPTLVLKESEITRSKNGTEYRGILAGSPRPAGEKFNPLQLINPFAPLSYGYGGAFPAAKPRIFRDERAHDPEGLMVISVTR